MYYLTGYQGINEIILKFRCQTFSMAAKSETKNQSDVLIKVV